MLFNSYCINASCFLQSWLTTAANAGLQTKTAKKSEMLFHKNLARQQT